MNTKKAAGKGSTEKKAAARKQAGRSQDSAERSVAAPAGKAKSTTSRKPIDGRSGAPASGKKGERFQSGIEKRSVKRAASSTQPKSGHDCEKCASGCFVEDPIEVAKRTMKGSVPAIVEAMVKKAKQGSCPHAKTLLEMTGAKFMFDDGPELRDGGESWARLVLERMEQADLEKTEGAKG